MISYWIRHLWEHYGSHEEVREEDKECDTAIEPIYF